MSTTPDKLKAEVLTFAAACRENTGANMLDSGGAYGRQHERPDLPEDLPMIRDWHPGCSATIETSAFLSEFFDIQIGLQRDWEAWDAKQPDDMSFWESGEAYMLSMGYFQHGRGNIYNQENDMSQVWVYEIYTKRELDDRDTFYNHDDTITVIYIHTGCDVRGGYGRPIFCRSNDDYAYPMNVCAQYYATKVDDESVIPDGLDEKWQDGYSSYPYGMLENDVETWLEETRTRDSVEVILKTGEHVLVRAMEPYIG